MYWQIALALTARFRTAWRHGKKPVMAKIGAALAQHMGTQGPVHLGAMGLDKSADVVAVRFALRDMLGDATETNVDATYETTQRVLKSTTAKVALQATAAWSRKVAQMLRGGAGQAHTWSNLDNVQSTNLVGPQCATIGQALSHHTAAWSTIWGAGDQVGAERDYRSINERRQRASPLAATVGDGFTVDVLDEICRIFKATTGTGLDNVKVKDVLNGTPESKQRLVELGKRIIANLCWPQQALYCLMNVLGKKSGGIRCISMLATLYRIILSYLSGDVRAWDVRVALQGDTAVKGVNARVHATYRHFKLELAHLTGRSAVLVLFDGEKCSDQLDEGTAEESAVSKGFPLVALALGLMAHRSPRVFTYAGEVGPEIPRVRTSVLAGCPLSTSLARCPTSDSILEVKPLPELTHEQHVDDVGQLMVRDGHDEAAKTAICAGAQLGKAFGRHSIVLSDKSQVVASTRKLAVEVAEALTRKLKVPIRAEYRAVDLGIEIAGGARRVGKQQRARLAKCCKRSKRIGRSAQRNRRAGKLFGTGAYPQGSYGITAQGASPTMLNDTRRAAVASLANVVPPVPRQCHSMAPW